MIRLVPVAFLAGMAAGCYLDRVEFREQHCAKLSIERHGWHRPRGAYSTHVEGTRCYTKLWNGERVDEGKLDDRWRPE